MASEESLRKSSPETSNEIQDERSSEISENNPASETLTLWKLAICVTEFAKTHHIRIQWQRTIFITNQ